MAGWYSLSYVMQKARGTVSISTSTPVSRVIMEKNAIFNSVSLGPRQDATVMKSGQRRADPPRTRNTGKHLTLPDEPGLMDTCTFRSNFADENRFVKTLDDFLRTFA